MARYIDGGQDYAPTGISQGIYESSSTQKAPLGTRLVFPDGRVFRYAHFVADTNRALLVSQDVSATCQAEADNSLAAASAGATTITVTASGVTANQYQGGYFITTDDTGEGYCYRIKSNTATSGSTYTLELYDGLVAAIDTTTDYSIVGNMWYKLRGATAATDMLVSGVSVLTMDVSEAAYGWVQTWGVGVILADASGGAIARGDILTLSDGVTGAAQLQDAYTEQIIGYALDTPDDTGHMPVWLQICP